MRARKQRGRAPRRSRKAITAICMAGALCLTGCNEEEVFEFVDYVLEDEPIETTEEDVFQDTPTVQSKEKEESTADVLAEKIEPDENTVIFNEYLDTGFYDHYVFENYEILLNVSKLIAKHTDTTITDRFGRPEVSILDTELDESQYIEIMSVLEWRSKYPDFETDRNLGEALYYYKYEDDYRKFAQYVSAHDPKEWSWIIKEMNGYEYATYPWGVVDYYDDNSRQKAGTPYLVDYDTYAKIWDYYTVGWLLPFDDTSAKYIVYERLLNGANHDELADVQISNNSAEVHIEQITEHAVLIDENIRLIVIKVDPSITDVTLVTTQKTNNE